MENKDIINLLYDTMRDRGVWFTTYIDYTFGKKDCYKLNEYGKLANEKEENKVVKEINNYIGDGAADLIEAIGCWLQDALMENYTINFVDNLHMEFKDEPIVDGLEASEVLVSRLGGPNAVKSVDITKGPDILNESFCKLTEEVDWSYYNDPRFEELDDKYLPDSGEGDTKATQIVTAVNKLVYKWYNDGDVYDNVNSGLNGWANDLSDYANWLYKYVPASKPILETIEGIYTESEYEDLLKELADTLLTEEFLAQENEEPKVGSIYECSGPFQFNEHWDDEEEYENEDDNYWDNDEEEEEFDESKEIKTEAEEDIDVEDNKEDIVDTSVKPEDKIRQRTQDLYNILTDNGLDVNISTDNGENQVEVLLNDRDGKIIIPVREDNELEPITGGNIDLDDKSLETLEQVKDILSKEEV